MKKKFDNFYQENKSETGGRGGLFSPGDGLVFSKSQPLGRCLQRTLL